MRQTDTVVPGRRPGLSLPPALRYPAYRSYWFGTLGSVIGFQMLNASLFWLVHSLENSPIYLGYVGLANGIPAIGLNLFGGVLADKLNMQRLITATQSISAILIFLLATLTLLGWVQVWHVLAISFAAGAVNAFDQPARQALYPHLIDRKVMMSAVALDSAIWGGTRIIAPALAGMIIAVAGSAISIYVAGLGFVIMAFVIYTLKVPDIERATAGNNIRDMLAGVKFIRDNTIFSFLISVTFFNSFFGMGYLALMPIFAREIFGQGPGAYGILLSVGGVGSLLTTLWLGSRSNFPKKGLLLIGSSAMFGLAVTVFGLTSKFIGSYYLGLGILFLTGVFHSTYAISIMSSLQMMVPDQMRGRIMGFYGMTWSITPLGGLQSGAIANVIGAPFSVAIGGLLVSAFALGSALFNSQVRNLGTLVKRFEELAYPS